MNATVVGNSGFNGFPQGIDTKISVLNQYQPKNQFFFKDINSPMSKSASKKMNNSMAINNSTEANKPGPQPQMHLPNKQHINESQMQFKSVNHSIDQMKELSQTFDFHSQGKRDNI